MNRSIMVIGLVSLMGCEWMEDPEAKADEAVKSYVEQQVVELHAAVLAMRAASPTPDADGWNAATDSTALDAMKADWKRARAAYEKIESVTAVLSPELDHDLDQRYEGFLAEEPDQNLFDDEGVIGIHAIERILWSDQIPAGVTTFESALPGFQAPRFPSDEAEARAFKDGLLRRCFEDAERMKDAASRLELERDSIYQGLMDSMKEQLTKVSLAGTGNEESRYAQHTLADMRNNIDGASRMFGFFKPLVFDVVRDGVIIASKANIAFERIAAYEAALTGDAIPPVPPTWNADAPSVADLETDYGELFVLWTRETDIEQPNSLLKWLRQGAIVLGVPNQ